MDGRLEEDSNGLKLWFLLNKYLCLEIKAQQFSKFPFCCL